MIKTDLSLLEVYRRLTATDDILGLNVHVREWPQDEPDETLMFFEIYDDRHEDSIYLDWLFGTGRSRLRLSSELPEAVVLRLRMFGPGEPPIFIDGAACVAKNPLRHVYPADYDETRSRTGLTVGELLRLLDSVRGGVRDSRADVEAAMAAARKYRRTKRRRAS